MAFANPRIEIEEHPIDIVENLAALHQWPADRTCDEELTFSVRGNWSDYHISVSWREDLPAVHIACALEMSAPEARLNELYKLIALTNEQMWVGHFDFWPTDSMLLFRYGLLLRDAQFTEGQAKAMVEQALEACERYYQAFQYVVWAGKKAPEALTSTMFETQGQA